MTKKYAMKQFNRLYRSIRELEGLPVIKPGHWPSTEHYRCHKRRYWEKHVQALRVSNQITDLQFLNWSEAHGGNPY